MAELGRHQARRYTGTRADRTGMTTTGLPVGTLFVESDAYGIYWWDGVDWIGATSGFVGLRTETANYTAVASDCIIVVNAAGGNVQVTLPDANGLEGKMYTVKRIDSSANTVTVIGTGGDTIDDQASQTLNQYDSMVVVSDDTEWWIL